MDKQAHDDRMRRVRLERLGEWLDVTHHKKSAALEASAYLVIQAPVGMRMMCRLGHPKAELDMALPERREDLARHVHHAISPTSSRSPASS
ncbi:MAG: hypothetical protein ACT4P7_05055 [Gemmatimonadaceae bacterium]